MLRLMTLGAAGLAGPEGPASEHPLIARPKRLALLVYLVVEHPGSLAFRDGLLPLFWPEYDTIQARHALRQTLYHLRRDLGPETVVGERGGVGIATDRLWCDAVAFDRAVAEARPDVAVDLYRGEFLAGFHPGCSREWERWADGVRDRLHQKAVAAARKLTRRAEARGDIHGALEHARRVVELAPYDEPATRDLIAFLGRAGHRAEALAAFEALASRLELDLEMEPDADTRAQIDAVRAGTIRPGPRTGRPEESAGTPQVAEASADGSVDAGARAALFRARGQFARMTPVGFREAVRHCREAVRLHPGFAAAHGYLAYGILGMARCGLVAPLEAIPEARRHAERALALDADLSEAPLVLGMSATLLDRDWDRGGRHIRRAIELGGDLPASYWFYSNLLCIAGRPAEGRRAARRARELAPLLPTVWLNEVLVLVATKAVDEAAAAAEELAAFHRDFSGSAFALGMVREARGEHAAAARSFERAAELGGGPHSIAGQGHNLARAGRREEAASLIDHLVDGGNRYVPATSVARVYAALGDADRAFSWLERAETERDDWLLFMDLWPRFEGVREDPRFADLRRRIGLPEPSMDRGPKG